MSKADKPDWAERLQRTRKREYGRGWADAEARTIKLLEEHVWQIDLDYRLFSFKWKQRCRCGFYGVFNEHLISLIKGEDK